MLEIVLSGKKLDVRGPAIFLDRDGVINLRRPGSYVLNWSQFQFVPGIRAALKQLASLELPMILISNQAGVGKGLLSLATLEGITTQMQRTLLEDGVAIAAAFYCPHRTDENCGCRKPEPAMLLRAASVFNIDLAKSIFIGDSATDIEAAMTAGCKPVLFSAPGSENLADSPSAKGVAVARTAEELFLVASKRLKA
jgi:D-glycero-D-manno-heptose 1,7-bisphosphate phosphatase